MMELPAAQPFDFAPALRFLGHFPPTEGEQRAGQGTLTKAFRVEGRTVLARLTELDGHAGLRCEHDEKLPAEVRAALADRVSFYLSLDDDLTGFYDLGRADPAFAPVIEELHGYHQVKFPTPLESLFWAVLAQRTPLRGAANAKRAFMTAFGEEAGGHLAFPDLAQVLELSPERMTELAANKVKGKRLYDAVRGWAEVDEDFLRHAPQADVDAFLRSLPGIGPWASSFILIRGLGRMAATPLDKPLLDAARRHYGSGLAEPEMLKFAEGYGPWQGYWAHYLRAAG
ncbi:hypothetical protein OIE66_41555 [Nonomuraea sp. NBC_01738]|uniref:DNA-3-methyladenine glycosylase family protein n=1 Tax=Nonomuraea sp. NBC_01738 TaxID=2976003 RepID=UPI002E11257F|nr:hypothetical protein OIE66_41555 [Nonomuraea sp. NBC_01738]